MIKVGTHHQTLLRLMHLLPSKMKRWSNGTEVVAIRLCEEKLRNVNSSGNNIRYFQKSDFRILNELREKIITVWDMCNQWLKIALLFISSQSVTGHPHFLYMLL